MNGNSPLRAQAAAEEVRPARRIGNACSKSREITALIVSACGTRRPR